MAHERSHLSISASRMGFDLVERGGISYLFNEARNAVLLASEPAHHLGEIVAVVEVEDEHVGGGDDTIASEAAAATQLFGVGKRTQLHVRMTRKLV